MTELIDKIFETIKCYRKEEGEFMSKEIITNWINQFDEEDREFILSELSVILESRYIRKQQFKDYLKTTFFKDIAGVMKEKFNQEDIGEIFKRSYLINHQPEGKSQKAIIKLFEEVIKEELGLSLEDCGKEEPLCYIYLDDLLCTGDTVFKGIADKNGWLNEKTLNPEKTNREVLEEKNTPIFIVFYSIHILNMHKLLKRIGYSQKNHKISIWYFWQDNHEIDNKFNEVSSKLQFIYPIEDVEDDLVTKCKQQIIDKIDAFCDQKGYDQPTEHFYRSELTPEKETFFSNPENRKRFEKVILKKSIEIYNLANSEELRMRPLGYGLNTDKSFGFGTLLFSWRNVPFNTPLIFWYEHKGWNPLFKRKWSSYSSHFMIF